MVQGQNRVRIVCLEIALRDLDCHFIGHLSEDAGGGMS